MQVRSTGKDYGLGLIGLEDYRVKGFMLSMPHICPWVWGALEERKRSLVSPLKDCTRAVLRCSHIWLPLPLQGSSGLLLRHLICEYNGGTIFIPLYTQYGNLLEVP